MRPSGGTSSTKRIVALVAAAGVAAVAAAATASSAGFVGGPAEHASQLVSGGAAAESAVRALMAVPTTARDLCVKPGSMDLPGATGVPVWGFAVKPSGVDCGDPSVVATVPGPVLDVAQGDVVALNVTNTLARPVAFEAPGLAFDPGPAEIAAGATGQVVFTASAPGTYLYDSAGDAGRQQAMGLYGAVVVRPPGPASAYGSAASAFDAEQVLVLSELDLGLNADPVGFDMSAWHPTYWLINGRAHPQTGTIPVGAGQRLLLRYVNAGFDNTSMLLLGQHERIHGRDAAPLAAPVDVDAETFPAGSTADAVVTVPAGTATGTRYPLYNRQLHLTNGAPGDPSYAPGGMLTFIQVGP